MSSLKTDSRVKKEARAVLNTTIRKDVFDDFKTTCKKTGIPMNTVIEAFMRQFNTGEFYLKLGKEKIDVDMEWITDCAICTIDFVQFDYL